jgi:hypothetical protein
VSRAPQPTLPWARDAVARRALLAAAEQIEGLTLEAVSYLWSSDPYAYRADRREDVDEVAFGVDLKTREGPTFRAEWRMFGIDAGLLFRPVDRPPDWPIPITTVDVSDDELWKEHLGRRVEQVNLAWHVPEAGAFDSIWSVALFLEGDRLVVLALGTTNEEPLVDYMPDRVLVIFDKGVAENYREGGSTVSALGKPVESYTA